MRYWEFRRIIFNLLLIPLAVLGWVMAGGLNYAGASQERHYAYLLRMFVGFAAAANICYSLAYCLEFMFGDDPASPWVRLGRTRVFLAGLFASMIVAVVGGWNIARLDVYFSSHYAR